MWKILSYTRQLTTITLATFISIGPSIADDTNGNTTNHQSFGFNLPTPVNPHGFDEVRASDGTTCRSSISGGGPYVDVGGLGGQNQFGKSSGTTIYGRVVIPLGKKPDRLDCGSLYQLEIERLRHELRLARSGIAIPQGESGANWAKSGWNNNSN